MIESLLFLGSALALSAIGQHLLPRCTLLYRSPRWGIAMWQALIGSTIVCVLLGFVALSMPGLSASETLGELLRVCVIEFETQYSTLSGAFVTSVGIAAIGALGLRLGLSLSRQRRHNFLAQRSHHASLAILAKKAGVGVLVVDHSAAAIYCVPGHRRSGTADTVVVSTGALRALDDHHLGLVLRHEQAHLAAKHSRLITSAWALNSAFPRISLFRVAHQQIALLSEMHADDAVTIQDRRGLAEALYTLAVANSPRPAFGTPSGALSATGSDVTLRAQRLLSPHRPQTRPVTLLLAALMLALAALPVSVALASGGINESHPCCADARIAG